MDCLVLDIGCGDKPRGHVNLDLYTFESPHLRARGRRINPRQSQNFLTADAQHLPFRAKVFTDIYASHVLEHLPNPLQALQEWSRVAYRQIHIEIPNLKTIRHENPTHLYTWSRDSLFNLLQFACPDAAIRVDSRAPPRVSHHLPLRRTLNIILTRLFNPALLQATLTFVPLSHAQL